LAPWFDAAALEALEINPGARGETLSVADYLRLADGHGDGEPES
jgi:16S rRNA A1518/A1519 N6-dimethyltransferase RsmA/KsgA/DIM1 with predicted DNA glycosylase/AP lyase activity